MNEETRLTNDIIVIRNFAFLVANYLTLAKGDERVHVLILWSSVVLQQIANANIPLPYFQINRDRKVNRDKKEQRLWTSQITEGLLI